MHIGLEQEGVLRLLHLDLVHFALLRETGSVSQSEITLLNSSFLLVVAHVVAKVLGDELLRRLVHQLVVVVLQQLDAVQAAQLLYQQAQLLSLAQLLCRLQGAQESKHASSTSEGRGSVSEMAVQGTDKVRGSCVKMFRQDILIFCGHFQVLKCEKLSPKSCENHLKT